MVTLLSCCRCGYDTNSKSNLLAHLRKKHPCKPLVKDVDNEIQINELLPPKEYNEKTYDCNICSAKFNTRQNRWRHMNSCKEKREKMEEMLSKINIVKGGKQEKIIKEQAEMIKKLTLKVESQKTHKNELFYQLALEKHFGYSHKKVGCGITDITTDTFHAEIKIWEKYMYGVGQLLCYNTFEEKDLRIYLFGRRTSTATAMKTFDKYNIKAFQLTYNEKDKQVVISDVKTKKMVEVIDIS